MRVVVADDSVLLREGIARLLSESGFDIVGQAGDAEDLMRKVLAHKPDVAVVDIRMPPTNTDDGLRAAVEIRRRPETGVLVLSHYLETDYALELLSVSAEGVGYLLKDRIADLERFTDAVRRVGEGGSVLDPEVVARVVDRAPRASDPLARLTPREHEVVALMAEGHSNGAIARCLVVTTRAVEKHVTSIFAKLDLEPKANDHRRVLAVLTFLGADQPPLGPRDTGSPEDTPSTRRPSPDTLST